MENVKPIVQQVIKIWRLHKTLQLTLTMAMRQEIPFRLRKLLSRDYMVCSLLKKEMANFYDALKCCMQDACIMRPDTKATMVVDVKGNVELAVGKIVHVHRQVITEYEILLGLAEGSNLNLSLLRQHRKQMARMTDDLSAQSNEPAPEDHRQTYIPVEH
ncbi:hypothetical protein SAMN04487996_10743 [Dyadobacter soli]|uniref:Uncharacterized protein n=1 Tax=Dyadobacter soli TaxID=659014 RepID=A0A1G7FXF7_9BACT|nr:hypothetical protein [Dyadobacter soli]SDE80531.1 hypothetical protein SAMN04487996_10743 [Dyadobacter soli]